ncbi:MAG: hypothetical protein QM742_08815 [Aquabacterium sp.]
MTLRPNTLTLATALAALLTLSVPLTACAQTRADAEARRPSPLPAMGAGSFALIGDTPYGAALEPKFDRVIADINAHHERVRFVLHTGDIKSGSERCDDDLLQHRFNQFQQLRMAFILTPGDNEWTDCHRSNNGGYLPTERLARLRQIFFAEPGISTGGRKVRVQTQAWQAGHEAFVENTMWPFGGALIGTVHVVGSNNDLAPWNQIDPGDTVNTPRADRLAEFQAREAANLAWIDRIFDEAERSRAAGVLIAMQANPNFELAPSHPERKGFNAIIDKLTARAIAFRKPVVIAHGDSHYFRVDKPLNGPTSDNSGAQMLENVTRVENFGSQHVHWVEVEVDARDENVFRFRPHLIEANRFAR